MQDLKSKNEQKRTKVRTGRKKHFCALFIFVHSLIVFLLIFVIKTQPVIKQY